MWCVCVCMCMWQNHHYYGMAWYGMVCFYSPISSYTKLSQTFEHTRFPCAFDCIYSICSRCGITLLLNRMTNFEYSLNNNHYYNHFMVKRLVRSPASGRQCLYYFIQRLLLFFFSLSRRRHRCRCRCRCSRNFTTANDTVETRSQQINQLWSMKFSFVSTALSILI